MNAPLPLKVSSALAKQASAHTHIHSANNAYNTISHASNEVAGLLAKRLAANTQGETLFSPADRGRYATDASIYQVSPVGAFVPSCAQDIATAIDICRDMAVPIVPEAAAPASAAKRWAQVWS